MLDGFAVGIALNVAINGLGKLNEVAEQFTKLNGLVSEVESKISSLGKSINTAFTSPAVSNFNNELRTSLSTVRQLSTAMGQLRQGAVNTSPRRQAAQADMAPNDVGNLAKILNSNAIRTVVQTAAERQRGSTPSGGIEKNNVRHQPDNLETTLSNVLSPVATRMAAQAARERQGGLNAYNGMSGGTVNNLAEVLSPQAIRAAVERMGERAKDAASAVKEHEDAVKNHADTMRRSAVDTVAAGYAMLKFAKTLGDLVTEAGKLSDQSANMRTAGFNEQQIGAATELAIKTAIAVPSITAAQAQFLGSELGPLVGGADKVSEKLEKTAAQMNSVIMAQSTHGETMADVSRHMVIGTEAYGHYGKGDQARIEQNWLDISKFLSTTRGVVSVSDMAMVMKTASPELMQLTGSNRDNLAPVFEMAKEGGTGNTYREGVAGLTTRMSDETLGLLMRLRIGDKPLIDMGKIGEPVGVNPMTGKLTFNYTHALLGADERMDKGGLPTWVAEVLRPAVIQQFREQHGGAAPNEGQIMQAFTRFPDTMAAFASIFGSEKGISGLATTKKMYDQQSNDPNEIYKQYRTGLSNSVVELSAAFNTFVQVAGSPTVQVATTMVHGLTEVLKWFTAESKAYPPLSAAITLVAEALVGLGVALVGVRILSFAGSILGLGSAARIAAPLISPVISAIGSLALAIGGIPAIVATVITALSGLAFLGGKRQGDILGKAAELGFTASGIPGSVDEHGNVGRWVNPKTGEQLTALEMEDRIKKKDEGAAKKLAAPAPPVVTKVPDVEPAATEKVDRQPPPTIYAVPQLAPRVPHSVSGLPPAGGGLLAPGGGLDRPIHPSKLNDLHTSNLYVGKLITGDRPPIQEQEKPTAGISTAHKWTDAQWEATKGAIAKIEAARYDQMGGSGNKYAGKYQLGPSQIAETAASLGVPTPTQQQFLQNPSMQEKFMDVYTQNHHKYLMSHSAEYTKLAPDQQLQVLGYAHNQGAFGAARWLRTHIPGNDAFGTSGKAYSDSIGQVLGSKNVQQPVMPPSSHNVHNSQIDIHLDDQVIASHMFKNMFDFNPSANAGPTNFDKRMSPWAPGSSMPR